MLWVCGRCWSEGEGVGRKKAGCTTSEKGKEEVCLVFREKPRFERIFAAKMTGLPHAGLELRFGSSPARQRLSNDYRVMGWASSGQVDAG